MALACYWEYLTGSSSQASIQSSPAAFCPVSRQPLAPAPQLPYKYAQPCLWNIRFQLSLNSSTHAMGNAADVRKYCVCLMFSLCVGVCVDCVWACVHCVWTVCGVSEAFQCCLTGTGRGNGTECMNDTSTEHVLCLCGTAVCYYHAATPGMLSWVHCVMLAVSQPSVSPSRALSPIAFAHRHTLAQQTMPLGANRVS